MGRLTWSTSDGTIRRESRGAIDEPINPANLEVSGERALSETPENRAVGTVAARGYRNVD